MQDECTATARDAFLSKLEQRLEFRAAIFHKLAVIGGADGVGALDLPLEVQGALTDVGILRIADVQKRVADDSIGDVRGIGKIREKAVREALARWGASRAVGLHSVPPAADRCVVPLTDDQIEQRMYIESAASIERALADLSPAYARRGQLLLTLRRLRACTKGDDS